jgi:hypothetical protein
MLISIRTFSNNWIMQSNLNLFFVTILWLSMSACVSSEARKNANVVRSDIKSDSAIVEIWAVSEDCEGCEDCKTAEWKTESTTKIIRLANDGLIVGMVCIDSVSVGADELMGMPQLQIAFKTECHAEILKKSTHQLNKNQVILIDGKIVSNAKSLTPFSNGLLLSGLTFSEVNAIYQRIPESLKKQKTQ